MLQRIILFAIFASAIISTAFLSTILLGNSPYTASTGVLWAFYLSLYAALTTWISLLWYVVRRFFVYRRVPVTVLTCLRQSALLVMIVVLSLFFNTLGIFKIWDVAPLAIAAILIEFFFQAEKKPQATIGYENLT